MKIYKPKFPASDLTKLKNNDYLKIAIIFFLMHKMHFIFNKINYNKKIEYTSLYTNW